MEVHPPVDGEGQTTELDLGVMSQKLRNALGRDTGPLIGILPAKRSKLRQACPWSSGYERTLTKPLAREDRM